MGPRERDHAGADPNRIAAMGNSAGGHLAALLGTYPPGDVPADGPPTEPARDPISAQVDAVVDFYGPTDLAALSASSKHAAGPIRQFLGTTPDANPDRYTAASPVTYVNSHDPATLIVQGTADDVVTPTQSSEFAADLTAAGVPNRLILIRGVGHGFGLQVNGMNLLNTVNAFLSTAFNRG